MKKILYTADNSTYEKVCANCRMCEIVCSFAHEGQVNPSRSRIRVARVALDEAIPVTCLQCEDAPCMNLCPVNAIGKAEGDYVTVDQDRCIGCGICVMACPVGAIIIDRMLGVAIKCDLCEGDPQCVKYCPARVLAVGSATDLAAMKVRHFARDIWEMSRREMNQTGNAGY